MNVFNLYFVAEKLRPKQAKRGTTPCDGYMRVKQNYKNSTQTAKRTTSGVKSNSVAAHKLVGSEGGFEG